SPRRHGYPWEAASRVICAAPHLIASRWNAPVVNHAKYCALTIEERRYRLKIARSLVHCRLAKTEPGRVGVLLRRRVQWGSASSGNARGAGCHAGYTRA